MLLIIQAKVTEKSEDVMLFTELGQCIRFKESDVRPTGRTTMGVIGMNLADQDEEYVLMMFGDHHPHIPNLTPSLENAGRGWIVPYVIWSNKGLDEDYQVINDPNGFTSLNYIGMETLIAADISLPYYFSRNYL